MYNLIKNYCLFLNHKQKKYAHICGAFDNGTKKCCKYCNHFILWGTSTGYCDEKDCDKSTWDKACRKYKYNKNHSGDLV